jgi:hypothetical protein
MTSSEKSQYDIPSPLDTLGIVLDANDRKELLDRLTKRAIEEAEDDQPASQPTQEYENPRFGLYNSQSYGSCCPEEGDE